MCNAIAARHIVFLFFGSFQGGLGRGSGEAHVVSDSKIKKCMSCPIGVRRRFFIFSIIL